MLLCVVMPSTLIWYGLVRLNSSYRSKDIFRYFLQNRPLSRRLSFHCFLLVSILLRSEDRKRSLEVSTGKYGGWASTSEQPRYRFHWLEARWNAWILHLHRASANGNMNDAFNTFLRYLQSLSYLNQIPLAVFIAFGAQITF